jgi:hypothetical protein
MKVSPFFHNGQCFALLNSIPADQVDRFIGYLGASKRQKVKFNQMVVQELVHYDIYNHWFDNHYQMTEVAF